MKLTSKLLLAVPSLLLSSTLYAAPIILNNAESTINFSTLQSHGGSSVGYNPVNDQYYVTGIGTSSYGGQVFDASGTSVGSTQPVGVDVRSVYYDYNSGTMNTLSYNAKSGTSSGRDGVYQMGLDGNGVFTGSNTRVMTQLSGLFNAQSVAAYDSIRDRFYSYGGGNVLVTDSITGALDFTVALESVSGFSLQSNSIAYASEYELLIGLDFSLDQAIIWDLGGALLGTSQLADLNYNDRYGLGYANGQLFVADSGRTNYYGFNIFEGTSEPIPAPAPLILISISMVAMGFSRKRKTS